MARVGTKASKKNKPPSPLDSKIVTVLEGIKNAGFRSTNEFIIAFFNSTHAVQSLKSQDGKSYGPGKIMDAWVENVASDSRHMLREELMRHAGEVMKEEIHRASMTPELCIPSEDESKLDMAFLTSGTFGLYRIHEMYLQLLPHTTTLLLNLLMDPNNYERWKNKEKVGKDARANKVLVVIISAILFFRNYATNAFQIVIALFLASNGTSRRVVENLNHMGLSMSYSTIQRALIHLTTQAVKGAREAARSDRVYAVVFDNINFTLRKASQRLDSNTQQLNATTLALFLLPESYPLAKYELALSPVERRKLLGRGQQMTFADIIPSLESSEQIGIACKHAIRSILVEYHPDTSAFHPKRLQELRKHTEGTRPNIRRLDHDRTEFFPLPALNEEEASVGGTIKVLEKIYLERLGLEKDETSKKGRVTVGDWLSVRNLRLVKDERADESRAFERYEWIEEASMPFHFQMNSMFSICKTHFGSPAKSPDPACLEHHRSLLRRSKLDAKKPEYNQAKELVTHSLIARLLDCTRIVLKLKDTDDLKTWTPDCNELDRVVDEIYRRFSTTSAAHDALAIDDEYRAHSILFIRDALFFRVFQGAVRYADVGLMWVVYDHWIFMMRGAGCNNYGNELLKMKGQHLFEYPPGLSEVIERTWLVNRWGKEGKSIPTDLYLEHNNGFTKNMFAAMGSGASIEHVQQKSSANVEVLRSLAHEVSNWFSVADFHRGHKEVKAQADLRAIMLDLKKHQVHEVKSNRIVPLLDNGKKRKNNNGRKERAIKDVLWEGRLKLTEGGLWKDWKQRDLNGAGEDDVGGGDDDGGDEDEDGFAGSTAQLDHDLAADHEYAESFFIEDTD